MTLKTAVSLVTAASVGQCQQQRFRQPSLDALCPVSNLHQHLRCIEPDNDSAWPYISERGIASNRLIDWRCELSNCFPASHPRSHVTSHCSQYCVVMLFPSVPSAGVSWWLECRLYSDALVIWYHWTITASKCLIWLLWWPAFEPRCPLVFCQNFICHCVWLIIDWNFVYSS